MEVVSNQRDQAEKPASERWNNGGPPAPGSKVTRAVMLLLMVVVVALVVIWGISSRRKANAQLSQETQDLAIPTVSVIHPKAGAPQQEIVIPGDMQPYTDAPIFARTNGYLKKWYADIGANVKAGQLLAEIDSPEVDQQLQSARADLATAQANLNLAEVTATRYKDLLKTDSVAQQDVDNANGNFEARRTTVESAQANVKRLQDMQSFEKVYAPFDGVITARNTDIGQLIDSGSSGGTSRELFHIAAVNPLRVYINVPQFDSPRSGRGCTRTWFSPNFPAGDSKEPSSGVPERLTTQRGLCSPKSTWTIPPACSNREATSKSISSCLPREHVHAPRECNHFQIRGLASGDCEKRKDDCPDPGYAGPGFRNGDRNRRGAQGR